MSLLILIAALVWERYRPQPPARPRLLAYQFMAWLMRNLNAGGEHHGVLAWSLGVLFPALAVAALAALSYRLWVPLGWAFEVVVAYFCLGFRHASYQAASVARALESGAPEQARTLLTDWRPHLLPAEDADGLVVQAAEETLRQSLLRLFGVLFWLIVLGPGGGVAYLLGHLARDRWHADAAFCRMAGRAAYLMDWLPARATAISFAIVGNFQDAFECWRGQARDWGDDNEGVLLASAAGALGLRLGGEIRLAGGVLQRPELGLGEAPTPDILDGVVALVWRAVLLWGAVLGLLWLGSL